MADARRYRFDDLRRWLSALAAGAGVPPARASALASQLLWFDAAGAAPFGIATFPGLLEQLAAQAIRATAEGEVVAERGGTAVLDGQGGLPLLVLERAATLAVEKARENGLGLVRVTGIGHVGSAACIAAEIAVGPFVAVVTGPEGSRAVALPSPEGLPVVFDPALGSDPGGRPPKRPPAASRGRGALDPFATVAEVLAPGGGWLVAAISVVALEPLTSFHVRVGDVLGDLGPGDGRLIPASWDERRREARERGLAVPAALVKALRDWSARLAVEPPSPRTGTPGR